MSQASRGSRPRTAYDYSLREARQFVSAPARRTRALHAVHFDVSGESRSLVCSQRNGLYAIAAPVTKQHNRAPPWAAPTILFSHAPSECSLRLAQRAYERVDRATPRAQIALGRSSVPTLTSTVSECWRSDREQAGFLDSNGRSVQATRCVSRVAACERWMPADWRWSAESHLATRRSRSSRDPK